jgi:hypothetical protein
MLLLAQLVSLSNFAIYWDSNTFVFDQHKEQTMHKALEEMVRQRPVVSYLPPHTDALVIAFTHTLDS